MTPARQSVASQLSIKSYAGLINKLAPAMMVLSISLLMVWALLKYQDLLANLGHWRYAGVFLAEVGNSASMLVPTPGPAFTLSMTFVLNPVLIGIIGGLGAAIGELTGYYLGNKGRNVLEGNRFYSRFHGIAGRNVGLALFAFGLLPLPCDVAGLWAGTMRYPVVKFIAFLAAGKIIKLTLIAFAASFGLGWVS
jgi:membrane protein YqaA with SNARE-associated domain